jgi:ribosomal protein S18 acetylase RimI-like enzyme
MLSLILRPATPADANAIWAILQPVIAVGETWALPRDWSRDQALAYWFADGHIPFLAEADGAVVGVYYMRANQKGGGDHVANAGYVTASAAQGQGVARAMCAHSLREAAARGFLAMQFNIVVSSNERAVRLWLGMGFNIVGTLPAAFRHPTLGLVDAYVMHRALGVE